MEIEILKMEKNEAEFKIDNTTIAEVLRAYLNENVDNVSFAAWRKEHPSKPVLFRVETSSGTVKKAVGDAVSAIRKDTEKFVSELKKK
jgi:DNA-directed RNA polymerase subunit L